MREIRQSGSEGGEPQLNAAFLPLSLRTSIDCLVSEFIHEANLPQKMFSSTEFVFKN